MKEMLFKGVCTALITPFKDNKIDYYTLDSLIEFQIDSGVCAIVISGTTGESPTLSYREHRDLIKHSVKRASGRTRIIAGTGSNDTEKAVKMCKYADEYGADGMLVVTPYYNKANSKGLTAHYERICQACTKPVIVYNVPTRTCVNISPETYIELSKIDNICGIKEASANLSDTALTLSSCPLPVYSGNDDLLLPMLSLGGSGVISVMSNIFPKVSVDICKLFEEGKTAEARTLFMKYIRFAKLLFSDINPAPIKAVMAHAKLCRNELRLPMVPADAECAKKLIHEYELLKS